MSREQIPLFILGLALVFGIALRIVGAAGKKTIDPDEGISYMAATGHLGEYFEIDGKPPYGTWVKASRWKRFFRVEERFCFDRIRSDMARYDIHPPLYFWMIHLWSLIIGINLYTGPSLNIALALPAILLLYRLAFRFLGNRGEAEAVAFVWALSPTVMGISYHGRPYDLLALCTILLTLITVRCSDLSIPFRTKDIAFMAFASAAGMLTHYYFPIVILGCGIFLSFRLIETKRIRLVIALSSMAAGLAIFYLMHPQFPLSFEYQLTGGRYFLLSEMLPRLKTILATFGTFFWNGSPAIYIVEPRIIFRYLYPAGFIFIVSFLFILYKKSRREYNGQSDKTSNTGVYPLFFFAWTSGIIFLIYIFSIAPGHSMGPKYLSIVWPFFAFCPVLFFRLFGRYRFRLTMTLLASLLFFGSLDLFYLDYPDNKRHKPVSWLHDSNSVLLDNVARGILPGAVWHIPDDNLIFAADQNYLLENTEKWKPGLKDNSLFLSVLLYDNTQTRQRKILDLIEQDFLIKPASGGFWGYGKMFRLEGVVRKKPEG